jgi:hypothetical protein
MKIKIIMESFKMQLDLASNAITVRANVLQGVLTTKTFEGSECYVQMLTFIKKLYPDEQFIPAQVIVR